MDIQIITDSLSDIPSSLIDKFNIKVLPLTVIIDENEYRDGIDFKNNEFYELLKRSKTIPKTSQVTPLQFEKAFKEALKDNKKVLYIGASSKATGTYQSSLVAKSMLDSKDIYTFDTMALSYGCGMFVVRSGELISEGKSIDCILNELEDMKEKVDHIFTVDTLEYLQKGGRISSTKAAIGTLLNIKPILNVVDGLVSKMDQVRGRKKIAEKMVQIALERSSDLKNKTIFISHGDNEEMMLDLKEEIKKQINPKEILMGTVGCAIGTHTGPGVVAMFYHR